MHHILLFSLTRETFYCKTNYVEMFNTCFAKSSDDEPEEDETEEVKKRKQHSLSKVSE